MRLRDISKPNPDICGIPADSVRKNSCVSVDQKEAVNIFQSLQKFMMEVPEKIVHKQKIPLEGVLACINRMIESKNILEKMYQFTTAQSLSNTYLTSHTIRVMIYSLKMGYQMGYFRLKLFELALAALLYDVGMFRLPEKLITKEKTLTKPERLLMEQHPEMAITIFDKFKEDYPWLIRAAHQHHERENGQGYPKGIKGNEIDEYAKIIGICDSYEAMTHDRPYRKAVTPFQAVRELLELKNTLFSQKILKAFIQEMSLYPVGSYVKLKNNIIGRVIATNPDQPMKPVIRVVMDSKGNFLNEEMVINLKENPVLAIMAGLKKEEIVKTG